MYMGDFLVFGDVVAAGVSALVVVGTMFSSAGAGAVSAAGGTAE